MRFKLSLFAVFILLALPAAAQATNGYRSITFGPASPWSNLSEDGNGFTNLSCGQVVGVSPGQTVRVWNGGQGNNNYMHLGLAVLDGSFNAEYGDFFDAVTGPTTRQFDIYEDPGNGSAHQGSHAVAGTRRIYQPFLGGTFNTLKIVHQGGSLGLAVRANC